MQLSNNGQLMKISQKTLTYYKICKPFDIKTDFYFPMIS